MKRTMVLAVTALVIALVFVACDMPNGNNNGNNDNGYNGGGQQLPPLDGSVSIEGTARVGMTLTANYDLEGTGVVSFEWRRGDIVIGTNSPTYTIQNADENHTITVTVTRVGFSGSITSDPTDPVTRSGDLDPGADEIEAEGDTLEAQLDWLRDNAEDGRWYIVEINADESIAPQSLAFSGKIVGIILRGSGEISLTENGSIFTVASGVILRLDGDITLQGMNQNNAPLVLVELGGALIMEDGVVITDNENTSSPGGGGVRVYGDFTMRGGEISNNTATSDSWIGGGGVFINIGGVFEMIDGYISDNTADNAGGGVLVGRDSMFIMRGGEISGNTSNEGGAGVLNHGTFDMYGGSIYDNTAAGGGGGVLVFADATGAGVFTMYGSISGNNSTGGGGVMVVNGAIFNMHQGGTITGNTSSGGGGGVLNHGTFNMHRGSISGNDSAAGGGVVVGDGATLDMHDGTITGNTATIVSWTGGGGVNVGGGTFNMRGGSISGNNSVFDAGAPGVTNPNIQARAGGVFVGNTGTFTMYSGEIYDNTASSATTGAAGGGVFVDCGDARGGVFNMRGGIIHGNISSGVPWSNGGGISVNGHHVHGGNFRISDGIVCDSNLAGGRYGWTAPLNVSRYTGGASHGSAVAQRGTFIPGFTRMGDLETTYQALHVVAGNIRGGDVNLNLSFAPGINTSGGQIAVSILGSPQWISVLDPGQFDGIRWRSRYDTHWGGTFYLDYWFHRNGIGTHFLTVEVLINYVWYSRVITITVGP